MLTSPPMLGSYLDILRREARPARFVVSRLLMRSGLSSRLVIPKEGFRLRFYPTNASAQQWVDPYHLHDKQHGAREETFFRRYLRPGDVVVDVGANFGLTALAAYAAVGPEGRVHAFEPHPRIFDFLVGNIRFNHAEEVVTPYNLALGDHVGPAFLTDRRADDQNAISDETTGLRVQMSTLDVVAAAVPRITLLKIDVEGYEWFVLRGAEQTLARVDCVYFESYDPNYAEQGYGLREVVEQLSAHGFDVRRLDADGSTTRVAASEDSSEPENLVAVRDLDALDRRLSEGRIVSLAPRHRRADG